MNKTPEQLNNLRVALEMWATVKPEQVFGGLQDWRGVLVKDDKGEVTIESPPCEDLSSPPSCGSVACFGGWVPHWPHFKALGVFAHSAVGAPCMLGVTIPHEVAEKLFGDWRLFHCRSNHPADHGISSRVSDHEAVANRLWWALEHPEADEYED